MPDELLAQLVLRAREQGVTLEEMVVELLQDTLDEPTNAEIIAGIREGMRDAMLGNTRPAREFLDELEAEMRQSDWHESLRATYGILKDDPIQRYDQGEYEEREPFDEPDTDEKET